MYECHVEVCSMLLVQQTVVYVFVCDFVDIYTHIIT